MTPAEPAFSGDQRNASGGDAVAPIRLIDPDGRMVRLPDADLDVTPALCRSLYRDMVLARRFDQEAENLQRQGELGLWLSCRGQEGAQVGSVRALRDSDQVFPAYREHAAALCRGLTPAELLSQWRGVTHGGWDPAVHRFHINSLVLGTQALHATGYAMGVRAERSDEVVLAYLGDGATSQGDANEALNWAAVTRAPILFLCQNNQWAISTRSTAQAAAPLHGRAAGFGLRSALVDGNDVLAVYAVTAAAVASIRAGGEPAFIEALTYRMAGHSTSDDPRRYRPDAEVQAWMSLDPISRVRKLLKQQGWGDDSFAAEVQTEAEDLAARARAACLALADPALEDTFRHTLTMESDLLLSERERLAAYRESFL
jgi:2-oxoisovalerate dehydrogenase E1 component alpha subunit